MQVHFNNSEIAIFQLPKENELGQTNSFDLSDAILDLQKLEIDEPKTVGITSFSTETISEKDASYNGL